MTTDNRQMPTVTDFMSSTVHTVSPDTEITEAVGTLTSKGHSGAPVVDAEGHVIGVLTHEGCMRALSGAAFNREPAGRVSDHMSREFVIAAPTSDLFHVVSLLSNDGGRRVLIVADHKLQGIVTRSDALKALDNFRKASEQGGDGVNIESVAVGWSALTQQ